MYSNDDQAGEPGFAEEDADITSWKERALTDKRCAAPGSHRMDNDEGVEGSFWDLRSKSRCSTGTRTRLLSTEKPVLDPLLRPSAATQGCCCDPRVIFGVMVNEKPGNYAGFRWSGRRDLNSRRRPWQGRTLPLSYSRGLSTAGVFRSGAGRCQGKNRGRDAEGPGRRLTAGKQQGEG